ncbi:uncharacterized protein LACBIDRAFT_296079 [Laccaria bicolor S238N-H82]|uniref:Uncharacterized protein n=1 Tax=Laccaria bicolor (strain S238N-H82 / ATCC MYA-4686) TaxID=486041 RepID=B0E520_LACBS|nr:uncharacterized protein LACBIDRAFT_296079 [Laccaria bicolor S238N-H82]EDQ98062.1 hypothetical protein LACBIDRAFT_296079 [Laccaria bicolor S238N-H82]|eukprot:XP_001891288.1 hypothetical protein LACBIDRAFT_296079 [Laccaria bicolor S238N-H82]
MKDLLLSHPPAHTHPVTVKGAEAWELELGETVKHAGSAAADPRGVVRSGRGRNLVRVRVGGGGEGGQSVGEKTGEEGKGKGTAKDEEEKPNANEGDKEKKMEDVGDLEERKPDLWSVFDLEPPRGALVGSGDMDDPSALGAHSHPTEQDVLKPLEHDLTALCTTRQEDQHELASGDASALGLGPPSTLDSHIPTTEHDLLTTRQEALDQRELALAARQERIEGMEERVGEVQRGVGYREEAVERHEEAVERMEEAVGKREEAVERREKEVEGRERELQGREEKVAELEQAIDERGRALDQRGSELEQRSKRVQEFEETRSPQVGAPNALTLSNSWPITLLRSVVFRVLGDKTPFLFASSIPSSSPSSSNPNSSSSTTTTTPQRRPRRDWEARRDLYLSTGGRASYLVLVGIGVCAVVLKVLVRRLTGFGIWSWLRRRGRR